MIIRILFLVCYVSIRQVMAWPVIYYYYQLYIIYHYS